MENAKEQKPLVSVIVPVYNSRDYLAQCIESIMEQSYIVLEIIVVDDASTDGSYEMELMYANQDSRIVVLREEKNAGVGHARNVGLKAAQGEYCCFVDSDDVVDRRMVEKLLSLILKNNADIAVGGEHCPGDPWWPDGFVPAEGEKELRSDSERLRFILDEYLVCRLGYCIHGKLYATRLFSNSGVFFQEGISLGEDLAFNLKLLLTASKIVTCPEQLYTYFNRKGSLSEGIKTGRITLTEYNQCLDDIYRICKKLGDKDVNNFWKEHFFIIYAGTMDIQFRAKKVWKLKREMQQINHSEMWRSMSSQVLWNPLMMRKYTGSLKLFLKVMILKLY